MKQELNILLNKLELTHYWGFQEKLEIAFDEKLTVFIGKNGSGKTTILDALAKSFRLYEQILRSQNPDISQMFSSSDIHNEKEYANVKIDIAFSFIDTVFEQEDIPNNPEEELSLEEFEAAKKVERVHDLFWEFDLFRKDHKLELAGSSINPLYEYVELLNLQRRVKAAVKMPIVVWYPSMRAVTAFEAEVSDPSKSESPSIFDAWDGALSENAFDYQAFFLWFRQQHGLAVEEVIGEKEAKIFEVVKNAIYGIFGDEDYIKEISFSWQGKTEGEIVLKKQNQKKNLKVAQLSAGEKTLFLLVADLARRLVSANPGSENPLKEGSGIVMIDEVGLHLHPSWQRLVLPKLMEIFPDMQFVVTTHSPLVINHIYPRNIILLEGKKAIPLRIKYPQFNNYGAYMEDILKILQKTENIIPEDVQKELKKYFQLIDEGKIDEARKKQKKLEKLIDPQHPELLKGQALIDFKSLDL